MQRLPWPAPALLAWAGAWLVYAALQSTLGPLAAWLAACFLGVLASLLASIAAWGIAQGFVGWCGVLAAGAGAMVLWLSFRSPAKPAPRPSSRS